jgi:hypothetical protein
MSDNNYKSIADMDGYNLYGITLAPENISQYSDILKFSHARNCIVKDCIIWGGKEDCVDMNRYCDAITFEDCTFITFGSQHITIKGGSKNIYFKNCRFAGRPENVEVELGNYSEQSDEAPINIVFTETRYTDQSPVRVRCLNACPCTVTVNGGNVKVYQPLWVKLGFFKLYCILRKANIIK